MRASLISLLLYYNVSYKVVSSLQCLQCAMLEGWPTVCPDDGVLETLDVWDACMTWTLDNGTTVLQNFVMADEDCTEERLQFWGKKYLDIVWNTTGTAECCYEDGCNDKRPSTTESGTTSREPVTTRISEEISSSFATAPSISISTTLEYEEEDDALECDQCKAIQFSECLKNELGEVQRKLFGQMIKRIARVNTNEKCSCKNGFLPLYGEKLLEKCVDPIVRTSGIFGRCLVPEHCGGLTGAECLPDKELSGYPGFEEYKTCQCGGNQNIGEVNDEGLITVCLPLDDIRDSVCENNSECSPFGTALCSIGSRLESDTDDNEIIKDEEDSPIEVSDTGNVETDMNNDNESQGNGNNNNNNNNGRSKREAGECACVDGYAYEMGICTNKRVENSEFAPSKDPEEPNVVQECLGDIDCPVKNSICYSNSDDIPDLNEDNSEPTNEEADNSAATDEEPAKCTGGTNTNCNNGVCTVTCSGNNNNNNNNNNGRVVRESGGVCECEPGYQAVNDKSGLLIGCLVLEELKPEIQFGLFQDLPIPSSEDDKGNRLTGESGDKDEENEKPNITEIPDADTGEESALESVDNDLIPIENISETGANPITEEPTTHEQVEEEPSTQFKEETTSVLIEMEMTTKGVTTKEDKTENIKEAGSTPQNQGERTVKSNEEEIIDSEATTKGLSIKEETTENIKETNKEPSPTLKAPNVGIKPQNIGQPIINEMKEDKIDIKMTTPIDKPKKTEEEKKPVSGLKSCRLEFNEGTIKPFTEPITQATVSVFNLKWDATPRNSDGAVVRMFRSDSKERFYSIHILKGRTISISVGTSSGGRVRVKQVAKTKVETEINSLYWSEWWVAYKSGMILIGTVKDHDLTEPLLAWIDHDHPLPTVEMLELAGYRTKVSFKAECYANILRPDACSRNSDCAHLPRTQCGASKDDIVGIYVATCQCMPGYLPIPRPERLVGLGCYDPILATQTVGAECADQRHCAQLDNTECKAVVGRSACHCKKRTKPRRPDPKTGLVLGCDPQENRVAHSKESCQSDAKLHRDKHWVPHYRVTLEEDQMAAETYETAFYARFSASGAVVVRLLADTLDPGHVYSVYFKTDGTVSIYENYFENHWLGNFPREKLKQEIDHFDQLTELNTWVGLWIKVRFLSHIGTTIQAGLLGSKHHVVEWTDSAETAIQRIRLAGFGTPGDVEVYTDCTLF